MKIAVPLEGGNVCAHFGHAPQFMLVTADQGTVVKKEMLDNPGHEPGRLPKWLGDMGIEAIITGGMGERAVNLFRAQGIQVYMGVTGPADLAVEALLRGKLAGGASLCSHGSGHEHPGECGPGGSGCGH
ncbi:hypothetical protein TheveDRAFT_0022 [Thermanaerovibrio velox DSM 12556]|uniref:Dinitrogenase iron-molybdenum cofactor biosynthesis domain-containing protein n=1 Tax=Thermanaerovibrio velox DSM 12556 TaxID=926567 RepID=H0UMR6_9BACT|nr:NifB/NifX family molybdenum-iron cluster-binding protein [Thermanaerovibrio velox]EHM09211.1 hypothetical protein TheveDRAFT_0022 [Thermanaerovibrio velox DSM 12556]